MLDVKTYTPNWLSPFSRVGISRHGGRADGFCFASSPVVSMSWFAFESGCQLGHSDSAGLQNIEAVVHWGRLEIHWFSLTASLPLSSLSKWKIGHWDLPGTTSKSSQGCRWFGNAFGGRCCGWFSMACVWTHGLQDARQSSSSEDNQPWHTSIQPWE